MAMNDDFHTQVHAAIDTRLQAVESTASQLKSDLSKLQGHIYAAAMICGGLVSVGGYFLNLLRK